MPADRTTKPTALLLRQSTLTGIPTNASAPNKQKKKPAKKLSPDRVDTDAILAIQPKFVQHILAREKNHEFRKYDLRESVKRLWLYESGSDPGISYVMETRRPRTAGQIRDPSGMGNDDFDNGLKESKFGYPVVGLYKLSTRLKPHELKSKNGISPPQGYMYATRSLVDGHPLSGMEKVF